MRPTIARPLLAAVLLLATAPAAHAGAHRLVQVTQIPFSDWLAAQGATLVAFQARTSSKPFAPLGNLGVVDYAGERANANHLSFGFSTSGSVTLAEYSDGTGQVLVNEDFTNAINWANDASSVRIFGYAPAELAATPSDTPALATGHLQALYTVADASHPELDLANVTFFGGGTLQRLMLHSAASGALRPGFGVPDGTPGQCIMANTGIFTTNGGGATADGYPVEHVDVMAAGSALSATGSAAAHGATGGAAPATTGPSAGHSWGAIKALYR